LILKKTAGIRFTASTCQGLLKKRLRAEVYNLLAFKILAKSTTVFGT